MIGICISMRITWNGASVESGFERQLPILDDSDLHRHGAR